MPAVTTEGLILKRKDFGEADRVLTVLTDRFGKISVIAKGVRRITSRRAGNIELLNRVKIHLFKGKSYTLTEAESIETFQIIKENLTLSTLAFHIIELADRLAVEDQKNPYVYDLTVSALHLLAENPRQLFVRAYEVKLLSLAGFWSIHAIKDLNPEVRAILSTLERGSWREISELSIDAKMAQALEQTMHGYLEKIIETQLKSMSVLEKLKRQ
jgi:DNA repair protein RecO (recombination protein O)